MIKIVDRTGRVLYEVEADTLAAAIAHIVLVARARGQRADLRGVNLSDADLSDADLSDADLTDANMAGANITGADLRGAKRDGGAS